MAKSRETKWRDTNLPTGLSIQRNGQSFICSWKIGDENYGAGQWFEWSVRYTNAKSWSSWVQESIGKAQTKKTIEINAREVRQYRDGVSQFRFRVCGQRKDYQTETDTKIITHKSRTSSWNDKTYTLEIPNNPVVSSQLQNVVNQTAFGWKVANSNTSPKWYLDLEYQAVRVKNSTETNGAKASKWTQTASNDWKSNIVHNAEDAVAITEQSEVTNDSLNSYTRWFRCRSIGAKGTSEWRYARHVYAKPFQAQIKSLEASMLANGSMDVTVDWKSPSSKDGKGNHPIDQTVVEYKIQEPASGMVPSEGGWNTAGTIRDTKGDDGLRFSIDDLPNENQVLFVRVNNEHDKNGEYGITRGVPAIPSGHTWKLSAPEFTVVENGTDTEHHIIHLRLTDQSSVPDSRAVVLIGGYREVFKAGAIIKPFCTYVYDLQAQKSDKDFFVHYDDLVDVFDGQMYFGMGEYVADFDVESIPITGGVIKHVKVSNIVMASENVWVDIPEAPSNLSGTPTIIDGIGTINVQWDWSWNDAHGIILSWSDHRDAWESTDQPEEYEVSRAHNPKWNISGLETGKTWYIRARFYSGDSDNGTLSEWSEIVPVSLKSAPLIPNLELSKYVITEDDTSEASWAFSSTDGTGQAQAEICIATISGDEITYSEPILRVGSAQHVTLDAKALGFTNGNSYNLCVRVQSASGERSDSWSAPATLVIAEKPTVNVQGLTNIDEEQAVLDDISYELDHDIAGFSIDVNELYGALDGYVPAEISLLKQGNEWEISYDETTIMAADLEEYGIYGTDDESDIIISNIVVVSHTANILRALPLVVTAVGAGDGGMTRVSIKRKGDYRLIRPDESEYNGFKDENIVTVSCTGESTGDNKLSITKDVLVGSLDDGETYILNVEVLDTYGQSVKSPDYEFEVGWNKQAHMPLAEVHVVGNHAEITPIAPSDVEGGETCDIYRLSADKPELIFPNAQFGVTYVDPYPAIGEHGGHRVVCKSMYDDFITKDNERAILDLGAEDGDVLDVDYAIVDFAGGQIPLYYNVDVSHQWQKDFAETKYLGGSVQGDWNAGVHRSASIGTVMINLINEDDIIKMKQLAAYAGVAHLRTLDGTSFACDLQVSENRPHDKRNMVITFSLSGTRVDVDGYDGMTIEAWEEMHGLE